MAGYLIIPRGYEFFFQSSSVPPVDLYILMDNDTELGCFVKVWPHWV